METYLDNLSDLIYSQDKDNVLTALYIAKGMLSKKDFKDFIVENNWCISKVIPNRKVESDDFLSENSFISELNIFSHYVDVSEENIRLMIYFSANSYKVKTYNKRKVEYYYYGGHCVKYFSKFVDYFVNVGYDKFSRYDVLALSNFLSFNDFVLMFDSCNLVNVLHESDYYRIFKKNFYGHYYYGSSPQICNKYIFNKVITHIIDNNISDKDIWKKVYDNFIDHGYTSKYFSKVDFIQYLKYSNLRRRTFRKVIEYLDEFSGKENRKYRRKVWF